MSYRSKRSMSAALPTDASERPKKPTPELVLQSSIASTPTIPSASENQEKLINSNESNNPLMKTTPQKGIHTSPHTPLFSSKGQSPWGPFSPPGNGVASNSSPSVGTKAVAGTKSIWNIPPGTLNKKPTGTFCPKRARISNPKPLVNHSCSSSGDQNPSKKLKSHNTGCDKPKLNLPYTHEAAKQPSNGTRTKSDMLSTHNLDENQLHKTSSTTFASHANSAKKPMKPPHLDKMYMQHVVDQTKAMQQEIVSHTKTVQQESEVKTRDNKSRKSTSLKSRLPFPIPDWPEDVVFDAKDDVLTIDANGDYEVVSGHIAPMAVMGSKNDQYIVEFNEYYQPIRKGGWVLVKFLGCLARMGQYCPVGALNWHRVEKHLKVQIINNMREHFVIPEDQIYDTLALQHVDKTWRHYKWELKRSYFDPKNKIVEQHYDSVPNGVATNDWIKLVNFWFSDKGKQLSQLGKQARAQHCQTHIMGSNSYANLRAEYLDAKAKVETLKMGAPSTSRVELEDQAFHEVLNQGEIPERPQGFGFGVKKRDVYGVRGLLRK